METIDEVVQRLRESVVDRRDEEVQKAGRDELIEIRALHNEVARLEMLTQRLQHMLQDKETELSRLRTLLGDLEGARQPRREPEGSRR